MKNSIKIIITILILMAIHPLKAQRFSNASSVQKNYLLDIGNNAQSNNIIDDSTATFFKEQSKAYESYKKVNFILYSIIGVMAIALVSVSFFALIYLKRFQKEKYLREILIITKNTHINDLEQKINNAFEEIIELARKDDSYFFPRFKEVYPEFCKKFTSEYPSLTVGQLKFCAMLRLNFSTKEIADYTHISARSVEIKKSRLRKQLNINSSEDLNKWMLSF